jgi:hypothetical protein
MYFRSYCKVIKIPFEIAKKVINGRYKPYLSAVDDLYYSGTLWEAKINALQTAVKNLGVKEVQSKLEGKRI